MKNCLYAYDVERSTYATEIQRSLADTYVLSILRPHLCICTEHNTLVGVPFLSRTFLDADFDLLGEMRNTARTSPPKNR
jgi:hypothetical protein